MNQQHLVTLLIMACVLRVSSLLRAGIIPQPKLSEVDWNSYYDRDENGPGTYSFGYDVDDPASGNTQFRQEERFPNGTVEGSYGLQEADGNVRVVHYTADHLGYRVRIENSIRKKEDYPPRPVSPVTPAKPLISRQPANPLFYSNFSPPQNVYNLIKSTPVQAPQLIYDRKELYLQQFNRQIAPELLLSSNNIYSK